jgi:TRAP-type C4-dicarboxylate transport system permease small subunit
MRKLLDRILEFGAVTSFIIMIAVVLTQIISRYFLRVSVHWTEEASRFVFLYVVAFAAGLGVRDKAYVNVDLLPLSLRGKALLALQIFLSVVTLVFLAVVFYHSFRYIRIGARQTSASLRIPMSYIFLTTALIPGTMIVYQLIDLIQLLRTGEATPVVGERTARQNTEDSP